MLFTLNDVRASFDPATFARGRDYFERRRVLNVRRENGAIAAHVIGSGDQLYDVSITARGSARGHLLHGACSCPVAFNCKHAAATALAALAQGRPEPVRDAADGAVDSWVQAIDERFSQSLGHSARDHVRYTLDVAERYYVPKLELRAHLVSVLKSGALSTPRRYDLHNLTSGNTRHLAAIDRTIGRLIDAGGLLSGLGNVSPIVLGTLLDLLIATSRLHWRALDSAALVREDVQHAQLIWQLDDDGRRRLRVSGRPESVLLGAAPLWMVDPASGTAGVVDTGADPAVAALLAGAPSLTERQAHRVRVALGHVFSEIGVQQLDAGGDVAIVDRDPVPVLRLQSGATAQLRFAYGEHEVPADGAQREFRVGQNGSTATWARRFGFEARAQTRLQEYGLVPAAWPNRSELRFAQDEERAWLRFFSTAVPALTREGWRVEFDERFPYRVLEAPEEWHAELSESEAHWFSLDLGIDVDGKRIPLLPVLIEALAESGVRSSEDVAALASRAEPIVGRLPGGGYVALPPERVARVLATLADLFDDPHAVTPEGRLTLSPVQAAALAAADANLPLRGNVPSLRALIDELHAGPSAPKLPAAFKAELRPYQGDGLAWLQLLARHGFGGVLADDMGLGKTVQLLAHVAAEKAAHRLYAPVLIVAPTSVVPNWRAEIARFTPHLRVLSLTGADRAERFEQIEGCDIALTSYALLPRDAAGLLEREWSIAVLDEAQAIKNPRAKAALAARELRAGQRIAMTGTPIENHLEELWSIYAFAVPGLLGDRTRFSRHFRTPIEKHGDPMRRTALAARLRPFLMRRTKEAVAAELPEKTEIVTRVELAGAQRDLYETIRLAMHKRVRDEIARRGLARSRIVVLDALLKLRQVCCDPRLVSLPAAAGVRESQKLEALLEMLQSLLEDGRRVLLFSQFTSMLDLIKPELASRHIAFVELRGDTRDREMPVRRFQNREVPLFLISLKAGGTGLNLTAADTVIHYDPWWNPAVERQATDRAHRIGQTQHIFIYKLIAEGTVEERIVELQERKAALAAGLFDETSAAPLKLDAADIDRLFS